MASITSTGVGSGLDIQGLVSQLVEAETTPTLERLQSRETESVARISAFGLLRSVLDGLRGAASALGDDASASSRRVTSGDEEVFTAEADADTAPGRFDVEVQRLASAHKLATTGFADADASVGTGRLDIQVGDSQFSVEIGTEAQSLRGIRDAINAAADNTGVSATIVNVDDGSGGTVSRLLLTADETGEASRITVTVDDSDLGDADASGLSRLASAQLEDIGAAELDALVRIDGLAVTRGNNTIDDAVEGVTLRLQRADPDNPHALEVSDDTSGLRDRIENFVGAFNSVTETLREMTRFDPTTEEAGVLLGDTSMRGLDFQLRAMAGGAVPGSATFGSLAAIGIRTGDSGSLEIDGARLDAALRDDPQAVMRLFSSDRGVATRIESTVEGYVEFNGLLDVRTDGLNDRIAEIREQRSALERRAEALEQRYLARFAAMDSLVAQLQSTGDFLSQQIDALRAQSSRR